MTSLRLILYCAILTVLEASATAAEPQAGAGAPSIESPMEKQVRVLKGTKPSLLGIGGQPFVCAGIAHIDLGADHDMPEYFYNSLTGELISDCSGAKLCPPPGWKENDCHTEQAAFQYAMRPNITKEQAQAVALSNAGCNSDIATCQISDMLENGNWVFTISYKSFRDKAAREWVERFGMSKIVIGKKGDPIRSDPYK